MPAQPDETVALPDQAAETVALPGRAAETVALPDRAGETVALSVEAVGTVAVPTWAVEPVGAPADTVGTVAIPTQSVGTAAIPTQAAATITGRAQPTGYQQVTESTGRAQVTGPRQVSVPAAGPAPGPEVRFGPGVPAAPPTAPAWRRPGAAPGPRRRSAWRRVASILSTVLTVVLVTVVGLYLWQRISPLEITSVTAAVPDPPGDRCDITVDVVATVQTNGRAGTIRYQWLRSGAEPSTLLSERVGWGQRTVTLHLKWAFTGVGTAKETATVNITSPAPVLAQTGFTYNCPRR